jgi:hypothetical protein
MKVHAGGMGDVFGNKRGETRTMQVLINSALCKCAMTLATGEVQVDRLDRITLMMVFGMLGACFTRPTRGTRRNSA